MAASPEKPSPARDRPPGRLPPLPGRTSTGGLPAGSAVAFIGRRVVPRGGGEKWLGCSPDAVWVLRKGEVGEVMEARPDDSVRIKAPDGKVSPWVYIRDYEEEDVRVSAMQQTRLAIAAAERWLTVCEGGTGIMRLKGDLQRLQQSLEHCTTVDSPAPGSSADGGASDLGSPLVVKDQPSVEAGGRGAEKRRVSEAARVCGELGDGLYLTYDAQQQGMLSITFAKERVAGALLFAKPQKPVPAFKYKPPGKFELVRNCQRDKKTYFRGFGEFVKAAAQFDSVVQYADIVDAAPIPCALYFHRAEGGSERLQEQGPPLATQGCLVVAVVPFTNKELDGGAHTTLNKQLFISKGNEYGVSVTLQK